MNVSYPELCVALVYKVISCCHNLSWDHALLIMTNVGDHVVERALQNLYNLTVPVSLSTTSKKSEASFTVGETKYSKVNFLKKF